MVSSLRLEGQTIGRVPGCQSCGCAEGEQDVDRVAKARGNAERPGGLLEGGKRLSFRDAIWQAFEALGDGLHLDVQRRQPSASGRDAGVGHLLRSLF